MIKRIHHPSTEVECVALLYPGDQLPPPGGPHLVILAVSVVLSLPHLLVVMKYVDSVSGKTVVHSGDEAEGDSPQTGHGNCEQSFENLLSRRCDAVILGSNYT